MVRKACCLLILKIYNYVAEFMKNRQINRRTCQRPYKAMETSAASAIKPSGFPTVDEVSRPLSSCQAVLAAEYVLMI